jgi:hypothetical protein
MKRRNPKFGYVPRIAQQIAHAFGVEMTKMSFGACLQSTTRQATPEPTTLWLTFVGHVKDGLWCVDLFPCESIVLRSHWVLLVMDVFNILWYKIQSRQSALLVSKR